MRTKKNYLKFSLMRFPMWVWTWYAPKYPEYLQLEFNRTLLNVSEGTKDNPPSHQIALQLKGIKSIFSMQSPESKLTENWLELLNQDKLEPFNMNYDQFSFHPQEVKSTLEHGTNLKKIFGEGISEILYQSPIQLSFKASEVGIIVFADEMKIMTHQGETKLEDIEKRHEQWWAYWRKYWEVRNTKQKLPYDPLCEITIPAG